MQFHIEMDEAKVHNWVQDDDPLWADAREKYASVQHSDAIVQGIKPYLKQHQATADHIYRTWLGSILNNS